MASLAAELEALAELRRKNTLSEAQFERAKEAVIGAFDGDAPEADGASDDLPESPGDEDPSPRENLGYFRFWREAFTLLERNPMPIPKDHHVEWREHIAVSKQHDGAALRDVLVGTYETEIVVAALLLGVNWSVYLSVVGDDEHAAARAVNVASSKFWLTVIGFLSVASAFITVGAVYLLLVTIAPISDANLPSFVRSAGGLRCLMMPNVGITSTMISTGFFYMLAAIVPSDGAVVMIVLGVLLFVTMNVMIHCSIIPINVAVNAGLFGAKPAVPRRDLAKTTAAEMDRALRKKALENVRKYGMPIGSPGVASASPAMLEALYGGDEHRAAARRRRRGVLGIKKRVAAVSGAFH